MIIFPPFPLIGQSIHYKVLVYASVHGMVNNILT